MNRIIILTVLLSFFSLLCFGKAPDTLKLYPANNHKIAYIGRVDFSNKLKPRIWAPGVYIIAKFTGSKCQILINDEVASENNHNYLEITVDNNKPYRIKLTSKLNVIEVPEGLGDAEHTLLICKNTESNIGYIDFLGLRCLKLLKLPALPERKIEYFGDSITSGTGMDLSTIPCDKGQWYDQHNAFMSYGAITSRNLNAQWQLTALAGVGLVHSCCNMNVLMPQIFDKTFLRGDTINWNFKKYRPDVVTVCLGQNDGKQDSALFCSTYISFLKSLRIHYPKASIICLTSPMADTSLTKLMKCYLQSVTDFMNNAGDNNVYKYYFSKQFHKGCGGHPDLDEHKIIADELTSYIKKIKAW